MRNYRFYRLDGAGKISSAEWIGAGSDEEALEQARDRGRNARFELWEGERIVGASPEGAT